MYDGAPRRYARWEKRSARTAREEVGTMEHGRKDAERKRVEDVDTDPAVLEAKAEEVRRKEAAQQVGRDAVGEDAAQRALLRDGADTQDEALREARAREVHGGEPEER
ncbi:MAG: hypothetical protein FJ318_10065, partial [SAR202 cluster bacterium]|nr:hypothetical protein [SAR202 cluster bacterium]